MGAPRDNGVPRLLPGKLPWLDTGPWAQRLIYLWLWRHADAEGWVTVRPGELAKYLRFQVGLFANLEPPAMRKCVADGIRRLTKDGAVDRDPNVTGKMRLRVNDYRGLPLSTQPPNVTPAPEPGAVPYKEIVEAWNALAETSPLLRVRVLTPKRKVHLKARWQHETFREHWAAVFELLAESWLARTFRGCRDINWLVKNDENWPKVLEGKYADEPEAPAEEIPNFDP